MVTYLIFCRYKAVGTSFVAAVFSSPETNMLRQLSDQDELRIPYLTARD